MKNGLYLLKVYTKAEGWKYLIRKDRKFLLSKKHPGNYDLDTTYDFRELKNTIRNLRRDSDYLLKCFGVPKALRTVIMLGRSDGSLYFIIRKIYDDASATGLDKVLYQRKFERKKERREQMKRHFTNSINGIELDIEVYAKEQREKIEQIKRKLENLERKAA